MKYLHERTMLCQGVEAEIGLALMDPLKWMDMDVFLSRIVEEKIRVLSKSKDKPVKCMMVARELSEKNGLTEYEYLKALSWIEQRVIGFCIENERNPEEAEDDE